MTSGAADSDQEAGNALTALTAQARRDIEAIAHPRLPWLEPRLAPDGTPALDVLIVGAGQSGAAVAFGLARRQVRNVLVVDRAPRGLEGPWRTYARMPTLRSPKDYTGPDLDIPSLTYEAWHAARFGRRSWEQLDLIPRTLWAEYLLWVRDTTGVPVRNDTTVVDLAPAGDLIAATVEMADGTRSVLHARKVLLATGQDGMGVWRMPPEIESLPPGLRAHAADAIDFPFLRSKTVAIIGAGASALDNAAEALEHGAAEAVVLCRRSEVQVVQPYRWLTFRGFLDHLADLDDTWRWRFMAHILGLREGFPQDTYDRCARHAGFRIVTGARLLGARESGGRVEIATARGPFLADLVICGTGVDMDFALRPELGRCAGNIATWGDRYAPPEPERDARLARYPYLAPDFSLVEKVPGATPWISNVHVFSIASTMSFGPSGSSINAMTTVVPKVVSGLTRGLFKADVEQYWASLQAYQEPQAKLSRPLT
jgi:cation diffusion facilitator CzcD-associated flavoprotein CzcO